MATRTMRKEIRSFGCARSSITCSNPRKNKNEDATTERTSSPTRKRISELRRSATTHSPTLCTRKARNIKKRGHLGRLHRVNTRIDADIITESRKNTKPRRPRPTNRDHIKHGRDAAHPRIPRLRRSRRRRRQEKTTKAATSWPSAGKNSAGTMIKKEAHH